MHDSLPTEKSEHKLDDDATLALSGRAHVLSACSTKSKRVSTSTSHAETLSAVRGTDNAQMVAIRLTEMLDFSVGMLPKERRIQELMSRQHDGRFVVPVDHCTDCGDLFELVAGKKGVPQDWRFCSFASIDLPAEFDSGFSCRQPRCWRTLSQSAWLRLS